MEHGARIIRTAGRIAVSIRFNNARRHGGGNGGFCYRDTWAGMAFNGAADIWTNCYANLWCSNSLERAMLQRTCCLGGDNSGEANVIPETAPPKPDGL
jgi:hypothetical protein